MTMQNKSFTPIFLFKNKVAANHAITAYKLNIELVTIAKKESEEILDRSLIQPEIELLISNPKRFLTQLKAEVTKKFPFPKGTEAANLELMGIDYSGLEETISKITPSKYKYQIKDGVILPDEKELKAIDESFNVYTKTAKQTRAYILFLEVAERLIELDKMKLIGNGYFFHKGTSGLLSCSGINGFDELPTVNAEQVLNIK